MGWRQTMARDIQVIFERDPAAKSIWEVILCYPGLHALWLYRVAHWFYGRRHYTIARLISRLGQFLTGIDIHPGAQIGPGLFIDHGVGVVIGETAQIGENVTLYQGCTLGGTGKEKGKRHPTLGNNVVVAAGAKILGSFVVGDNAKIGAGAVVLHEVPPNSTVVGVPGRVVVQDGRRVGVDLRHDQLPDPVERALARLQEQIDQLSLELAELQMRVEPGEEPDWSGQWASLASMEGIAAPVAPASRADGADGVDRSARSRAGAEWGVAPAAAATGTATVAGTAAGAATGAGTAAGSSAANRATWRQAGLADRPTGPELVCLPGGHSHR